MKKSKEQWEVRLDNELCARWRDRRINYEKEIEGEKEQMEKEPNEEQQDLRKGCHEESISYHHEKRTSYQKEKYYEHEAKKSIDTKTTLLLPIITVPDKSHETSQEILSKLPLTSLSGIDSVCVVSYIQSLEDKTTSALQSAKYYRDIAEKIREENINSEFEMEKRLQRIRGFWRNQINEGSSRAGKIVQMALNK